MTAYKILEIREPWVNKINNNWIGNEPGIGTSNGNGVWLNPENQ